MIYRLLILFFIPVLTFAQGEKMTTAEAESFRKKAEKETKSIQTLQTGFVQQKQMTFLSTPIETEGYMIFEAPNKLLWKYTKPYEYSILFRDNKVFINNEGAESTFDVGNNQTVEKINQLIMGSVSGDLFDDDEFFITYYKSASFSIAVLIPKSDSTKQYISRLELYFTNADYSIAEVRLIEPSEDFTHIVFKNKKINLSLDKETFTNN